MVQYSNALARRTGSAHVRSASGNGFFEYAKEIPSRLFSDIARKPIMFGGFYETQREPAPSTVMQEPIHFGSDSLGKCGWYGNEPEAKMAGGSTMYANGFFGNIEEETIEYLGANEPPSPSPISMGAGALIGLLYIAYRIFKK